MRGKWNDPLRHPSGRTVVTVTIKPGSPLVRNPSFPKVIIKQDPPAPMGGKPIRFPAPEIKY